MNSKKIFEFLTKSNVGKKFIYSFNGFNLAIGSKSSNPILYSIEKDTIDFVGRIISPVISEITSIFLSDDNKNILTGYSDGSITIWEIENSSVGAQYKLFHNKSIQGASFLNDKNKILIIDQSGLVSLVCLVPSSSCELIFQTTIVNIKNPILNYYIGNPNIFALSSYIDFSILLFNRKIEVLLSIGRNQFNGIPNNFSLNFQDNIKRVILCYSKNIKIIEIISNLQYKEILNYNFEDNLIKSFFIDLNLFLFIFDNNRIIIMNINKEIILNKIFDQVLLTNNIYLYNKTLYFFS